MSMILEQLQALMRLMPDPPRRRCSVWVTPNMPYGDLAIIDTSQLNFSLEIYRGRDPWPEDMLLVVMNGRTLSTLREMVIDGHPEPIPFDDINHRLLAEWIIDGQCEKNPALNAKLRWRVGGTQ